MEVVRMGKMISSLWHKLVFFVLMLYLSGIFVTICLPIMWLHYRIPIIHYYTLSLGILFLGGMIFNIFLTNIYPIKEGEPKKEFSKGIVLKVFTGKFIIYSVLSLGILVFTGNFLLGIFYLLFLMIGGYIWFCILRGYINAKNNNGKGKDHEKGFTLQGRTLLFSIPISLIIGYFILCY